MAEKKYNMRAYSKSGGTVVVASGTLSAVCKENSEDVFQIQIPSGETAVWTAIPNEGYDFDYFHIGTHDANGEPTGSAKYYTNPVKFSPKNGGCYYTACFVEKGKKHYTCVQTVGGTAVVTRVAKATESTKSCPKGIFCEDGEKVTLKAVASASTYNNGYVFDHWECTNKNCTWKCYTAEATSIPTLSTEFKAIFKKSPYSYVVGTNAIQIKDSYMTKDKTVIRNTLESIKKAYPNHPIFKNRSMDGLVAEWYIHSRLYGYWMTPSSINKRLKDVDLEYPLSLNGKSITDAKWISWANKSSNWTVCMALLAYL